MIEKLKENIHLYHLQSGDGIHQLIISVLAIHDIFLCTGIISSLHSDKCDVVTWINQMIN